MPNSRLQSTEQWAESELAIIAERVEAQASNNLSYTLFSDEHVKNFLGKISVLPGKTKDHIFPIIAREISEGYWKGKMNYAVREVFNTEIGDKAPAFLFSVGPYRGREAILATRAGNKVYVDEIDSPHKLSGLNVYFFYPFYEDNWRGQSQTITDLLQSSFPRRTVFVGRSHDDLSMTTRITGLSNAVKEYESQSQDTS
jgi:hypothetical protein